jgi:glycosyltransferase involved in cell wall biosynthesis
MRVVLVTPAPEPGGVSRHVFDLADALRERGWHITLALRGDAAALIAQAADRGLRCVPLEQAWRQRADVWHLHLHNTMDLRVLPLMLLRRVRFPRSSRLVLTEHLPRDWRTDDSVLRDPAENRGRPKPGARSVKRLMKLAEFALADRVVAVGASSGAFLGRRYRARPGKIRVIHNGVRSDALAAPAPPRDDVTVTVVGSLGWRKGVDLLLRAARASDLPWRIVVVGDGPARQELEQQAAALAPGRVQFTGWLDDPSRTIRQADLLALPSRAESFGYVLLEAMVAGRAVVATAVDGPDEVVLHGVTGLLVPPEDHLALAQAIDALAADRPRRLAMGEAGRVRAHEVFGLDDMVTRTLTVYGHASA